MRTTMKYLTGILMVAVVLTGAAWPALLVASVAVWAAWNV